MSRGGPVTGKRKTVEVDQDDTLAVKSVRRDVGRSRPQDKTSREEIGGRAGEDGRDPKRERSTKAPRGQRGNKADGKSERTSENEGTAKAQEKQKVGLEKLGSNLGSLIGRKRKMRRGDK